MTDQTMQDGAEPQEDTFAQEAREMGWVEKEEWEGPEEKWVDAKTFVERGEHIMPILRANNKRLKQDLLTRDKEIDTLKQSVDAANKAIKALQKHYTEATERAVEQARKDLREQLKQAREVGDVDAEEEIREKLTDLKEAKADAVQDQEPPKQDQPQYSPDFIAWKDENPWFGRDTPEDRKRTKALVRIAEDLREEGDRSEGRTFMEKCMKVLEKQEGGTQQRAVSKAEGGGPGARTRATGRAFDNLPKEAKDICHADNETFVGPGKMFKTVKDWEDHYATLYSEE
jgi:chromosome segregation ATPase